MKAFLLAAGTGTRLRPITDTTPKCLVTIGDRTLLDIWLDAFARAGVTEVLINLNHLADAVRAHVATRTAQQPAIRLVFEPELLGSAGTLAAGRDWVAGEEFFLACNADNLTDFDLADLIAAHRADRPLATMAVFRSKNPSAGGVVALDESGRIVDFTEKPAQPASDLVNAGIYAFSPAVLGEIADKRPVDIGYDLLPRLVGNARAVLVDGYFRDIGTPEAYYRAREEWPARALR
jgi:mannose-1-phosphate guanylyltransferase